MLRGASDECLADLLLVATEILANAYDHGNGPQQVRLSCDRAVRRVRIEVDDRCRDHPTPGHSRLDAGRGRGMIIVAGLAEEWGVRDHPGAGGKTVWADIHVR